ncbi:MAG: hypothetical protein PHQ27_06770 [Victivallales bacterium]|nr:hypothetical protein [Victivallales bacterium]
MTGKEEWRLWRDGSRSPYDNMAIDELLLQQATTIGTPVVRIYDWDRPAVSIGYVQKYDAAPQQDYTIVRRPPGGGVVFHDVDLTYTVVVPAGHAICRLDRMESYHVFHRAILRLLDHFGHHGQLAQNECGPVDRATMQCFTTPTRYDVLCGQTKYAGAAQRRTRDGILHQGSIAVTAADGDKTALAANLADGLAAELGIVWQEFTPSDSFMATAVRLGKDKYARPEWNITRTWKPVPER